MADTSFLRNASNQGSPKAVSFRDDEWVRPLFAHYRGLSLAGIVLGVIAVLFAGALMFTSGYMISLAASIPLTVLALHVPSIFVRIFGIGKPLIDYVQRLSTHDWVLRATSVMRRRLYGLLESMQSSVVESKRSGEVLGLLANDIEHVQNLCIRSLFPWIISLVVYAIVCIALGVFNLACALLILVLLGVVIFVVPLISLGRVRPGLRRLQRAKDRMYVGAMEDIRGLEVWALARRRDGFLEAYRDARNAYGAQRVELERRAHRRSMVVQAIIAVAIGMVFLFAALAFGEQEPGFTGSAVEALSSFSGWDATAVAANWIAAFVLCAFPIFETLAAAPEEALSVVEHEDAVARLNALSAEAAGKDERSARSSVSGETRADGLSVPDGAVAIAIEDVSFSYPSSSRTVIEDLSLTIPAGSHVAVLGRSGSGKSTLARLVYGELEPTKGNVRVGGADPARFEHPHEVIATLYQNAYIFDSTLRENLLVADGKADDDRLRDVLFQVGLGELIEESGRGLDMPLGEGGTRLSGGQRQRVAFARMLLVDAPIVILDEPFLWVDEETERRLSNLVREVFRGRTVILITHYGVDDAEYDQVVHL